MTSPRHPLSDILSHIPVSASIGSDGFGETSKSVESDKEVVSNSRMTPFDDAHERTEGIGECVVISFEAVKRHRFTVGAAGGRLGGNGSRDAAAPAASLRKHQNVAAAVPTPAVNRDGDRRRGGLRPWPFGSCFAG